MLSAAPTRAETTTEKPPPPAPRFEGRRGDVVFSVERLVPIVRYSEDSVHQRSAASFGWGIVAQPESVHDVPRLAVDVAIVDRLTVGAAPILSIAPSVRAYAFGIAPRIGYVIPTSRRVSLWPHVGSTYVFASSYGSATHSLALSGEVPWIFGITEHAAVSLGVGFGAPLAGTSIRAGSTNANASYIGGSLGLTTWF